MIAVALREKKAVLSCAECEADPSLRERRGCGDPIVGGADVLGCHLCEGEPGNKDCPECEGTGELTFKTCPMVETFSDPMVPTFLRCRDMLAVHGVFPAAGGLLDQSKKFLDLFWWAERVRMDLEDDE